MSKLSNDLTVMRMLNQSRNPSSRNAFTLTEMLIAMAVTLIMMAALGKTFALMGNTIQQGRSKVELTSQLRDVTLRIQNDISRRTVQVEPASPENRGDGYFFYYEGPLTNATGTLMGASPSTASNQGTLQDSRIGDLDDYLAFTAVAEPGNWFRGKVPRFLLDMKQWVDAGGTVATYMPSDFPGNPYDPVVIKSKYAEIVYFASPEYELREDSGDSSKQVFEYTPSTVDAIGQPVYIDNDSNGLPDRVRLHRRVLLIRPDLNLDVSSHPGLATYTHSFGSVNVTYMQPDGWSSDATTNIPGIKTVSDNGLIRNQTSRAWLFGMAPIHQQCDLSVRRGLNANGQPNQNVFANSLADLTKPENRFAHVRIPGSAISATHNSAASFTSMPLLACGGTPSILDPRNGNAATPPVSGTVVTPTIMNGFLRPEFVLGMDHTHTDYLGDGWGIERLSEDVIASQVIGFDVKGFDPGAQTYISFGPDEAPGVAGTNDNRTGNQDDALEAGFSGSDDVVMTPNDAGMREFLIRSGSGTVGIAGQVGEFVDLFHPYLAGGTVRGPAAVAAHTHGGGSTAISTTRFRNLLISDLSGMDPNSTSFYSNALYKSGRMVTSNGNVLFMQPAYDTFSDHYERDGYRQSSPNDLNGTNIDGTMWYANNESDGSLTTTVDYADRGSNGIDDDGYGSEEGDHGVDGASERETSAPFVLALPAVKVSLRLENSKTRQVEQMSAINYLSK